MRDRAKLFAASLAVLACVVVSAAPAGPTATPRDTGLKESARIDLVQLEVTVWPKTPGSDACLGLNRDDFELLVDGKPRPIYAVDAIGSTEDVYAPDAPPAVKPAAGGMSLVLYFAPFCAPMARYLQALCRAIWVFCKFGSVYVFI